MKREWLRERLCHWRWVAPYLTHCSIFCFGQADDHKCAIYIPTFALVELGEACRKGHVSLSLPFQEWTRLAFASGKYHEAPLTAEVVCVAQGLYEIPERGDRLIAATAAALDLPLITRDPEIAQTAGVECIWS